jgi:hypothetical protein
LRLKSRALLNGEGTLLEFIDSCDFADAPDVIEAMLIEAPAVPDVIQATLIELAFDKILNRACKPLGHVF